MTTTWTWRKSSRSATNGECVEVGTSPAMPMVAIRDSKLGDSSPVLRFTRREMTAFLHGTKAGQFDNPA